MGFAFLRHFKGWLKNTCTSITMICSDSWVCPSVSERHHLTPPQPSHTHLLHCGIIKEDPSGCFGVVGKGAVVSTGVADHSHKEKLGPPAVLIRHAPEKLQERWGRLTRGLLTNTVPPSCVQENQGDHVAPNPKLMGVRAKLHVFRNSL